MCIRDRLMVFEAPIDLLSFIELFPKNWQQHNYLSLGGVSGKALRQFLSERPDVELSLIHIFVFNSIKSPFLHREQKNTPHVFSWRV